MRKLLYIDSCVMRGFSRTERLAQALLTRLATRYPDTVVKTRVLEDEKPQPMDTEALALRNECVDAWDYSDARFDYAREFVDADEIIISAPYWDLSFPASLKAYLEQLCVNGLAFSYDEQGIPKGYAKANRLWYVTTVGGYVMDYNMGYEYVEALCKLYFGIQDVRCVMAEGLDIVGNNPDAIMAKALDELAELDL